VNEEDEFVSYTMQDHPELFMVQLCTLIPTKREQTIRISEALEVKP